MTDLQEEKLDSFYVDYMQVAVPENKEKNIKKIDINDNFWLRFNKICKDKGNYSYAVEIHLEDRNNSTSNLLGIYYHAVWKFSAPMYESIFWQIVKAKPTKFKKIFDKMRMSFPKKQSFLALLSMTKEQRNKMKELKKKKKEIEKNISKK